MQGGDSAHMGNCGCQQSEKPGSAEVLCRSMSHCCHWYSAGTVCTHRTESVPKQRATFSYLALKSLVLSNSSSEAFKVLQMTYVQFV